MNETLPRIAACGDKPSLANDGEEPGRAPLGFVANLR
jgi:hypothetical protein